MPQLSVPKKFQRSSKEVPKKFQRSSKEATKKFQGSYKEVLKKSSESPQKVLKKSSKSPQKVLGKSSESPQKVLRKSSKSPNVLFQPMAGHRFQPMACLMFQNQKVCEWVTRSPIELFWTAKKNSIAAKFLSGLENKQEQKYWPSYLELNERNVFRSWKSKDVQQNLPCFGNCPMYPAGT